MNFIHNKGKYSRIVMMCPPYRAALQSYQLAGLPLLFTGHILSAGCRKSQRLLRVRPQDRIPQKSGCLRFDTVPLQSGCSCSLLFTAMLFSKTTFPFKRIHAYAEEETQTSI